MITAHDKVIVMSNEPYKANGLKNDRGPNISPYVFCPAETASLITLCHALSIRINIAQPRMLAIASIFILFFSDNVRVTLSKTRQRLGIVCTHLLSSY